MFANASSSGLCPLPIERIDAETAPPKRNSGSGWGRHKIQTLLKNALASIKHKRMPGEADVRNRLAAAITPALISPGEV
jgi:hypothetical protein